MSCSRAKGGAKREIPIEKRKTKKSRRGRGKSWRSKKSQAREHSVKPKNTQKKQNGRDEQLRRVDEKELMEDEKGEVKRRYVNRKK